MAKQHSPYGNENTQFADSNEATQFNDSNDEATQFDRQFEDHTAAGGNTGNTEPESTVGAWPKKKKPMGKRIATGAAIGVALGGGMAALSSAMPPGESETEGGNDTDAAPEWSDGEVPVAHGVSDDMSFTDAFDTARMEVGPGGVFEWNGYIYSTYTREEWDSMSPAEQQAFGAHFSWTGDTPAGNADVEVVGTHAAGTDTHAAAHTAAATHTAGTHTGGTHTGGEGPDYLDGQEGPGGEEVHIGSQTAGHVTPASTDGDAEVEILGVQHDDQTGYTYANLTIDSHDAVLVDINGDNTFDVLAIDANNNGRLDDNEMIDVSGHGITAQSLGIDTQNAQLMAQNTGQDTARAYIDPVDPAAEEDLSLCGTPAIDLEHDPSAVPFEDNAPTQDDITGINPDMDNYAE